MVVAPTAPGPVTVLTCGAAYARDDAMGGHSWPPTLSTMDSPTGAPPTPGPVVQEATESVATRQADAAYTPGGSTMLVLAAREERAEVAAAATTLALAPYSAKSMAATG